MLKKTIAIALSCSLLMSSTVMAAGMTMKDVQLAQAQTGVGIKDGEIGFTFEQGHLDGVRLGKLSKKRKYVTGLVVGTLTGPIGAAIGYFVVGPAEIDGTVVRASSDKGSNYQMGFRAGWEKQTKSRRRSSFLAGGLFGSLVCYVIYSSTR